MQQVESAQRADNGVTSTDVAMMQRAITLARRAAAEGEIPVGAVIYRGTEIIAEAANNREFRADPTGHAELVAIRDAGRMLGEWRLSDCSLAVTLEPCPMCAGAIVNARVGRVIFGATDPKAGACTTLYGICTDSRLNHRVELHAGVLSTHCAELLRVFFRERREAKRLEKLVTRVPPAAA